MAELHILGTLVGASEFPKATLCCQWELTAGEKWTPVEGDLSGQTHVDVPLIRVQVYYQDMFGRNELYGYGFAHIPSSPGLHKIDISTWRPVGTPSDQIWSYFLGATPQLKNLDLIDTPTDRFRLITASMGKVHLEINVMLRNFHNHGIDL
ncbi:hypothetical protein BATDEDRAFT_22742 [Batrachochytrium dendrobatidis JAM81]|uniref:B9 domain-containing protein 2 n=1 Tax=Batrachochytrium dendrobatidis (strain JAM81 / FGSC 10211) TaxID=684364 RepID=F4NXF4_BATDJ|nr:uncharacterized protein BATDEDRAFT_22742 [Batrachochytrium dendrobatidis JAM81]EGF82672.1 hypothetical protein BATDEDRAFT_22742 [Batrachochytrium dendrobatidis JAM81]|eukprot:XP_006676611.1 hypothetical protein BATDEDRAFT_22742 [Batrachochytrium dendrobatidis JAM81]